MLTIDTVNDSCSLDHKLSNLPSPTQTNRRTLIKLDEDIVTSPPRLALMNHNSSNHQINNDLSEISFLLSIFDNIVGPRVVHYWSIEQASGKNANLDDHLLKYIAIHTLNGELYQDKLNNQQKFRLYLIKEIECAIFSIFFDASTLSTLSSGNSDNGYDDFSLNNNRHLVRPAQTCLNCFSIIVPLNKKNILLQNYGENTKFFINSFENMILEYKVYAHIKPKVDQITLGIDDLTRSIKMFCKQLCTIRSRGLYPIHLFDTTSDLLNQTKLFSFKINVIIKIFFILYFKEKKINFKILKISDTFLNDCTFTSTTHSMNNDFLVNSITSHLITNHNTIVIGTNSKIIDKVK